MIVFFGAYFSLFLHLTDLEISWIFFTPSHQKKKKSQKTKQKQKQKNQTKTKQNINKPSHLHNNHLSATKIAFCFLIFNSNDCI